MPFAGKTMCCEASWSWTMLLAKVEPQSNRPPPTVSTMNNTEPMTTSVGTLASQLLKLCTFALASVRAPVIPDSVAVDIAFPLWCPHRLR